MAVQVIKATKPRNPHSAGDSSSPQRILRTACYVRVSTLDESQNTSFESQLKHYVDYINRQPGMVFAGAFCDHGISGTTLHRRDQFNKMMEACEAGLIDKILTKSLSRWSRNTLLALKTIRRLQELGISVFFERENIDTLDTKGELLITILSSIAQQESNSISKNVRMGFQFNFQQGKPRLNTKHLLGFEKNPEDKYQLVIEPEGADLVRRIYRLYLEGHSYASISGMLTEEEIPTPAGKSTWYPTTVEHILTNEKYCGDILMQKYYVSDFLSHKLVKNDGVLPQYFVEDHHDPIVPKEVYYQVQGEIQRRSRLRRTPGKIRFGNKQALTGRLICGHCGRTLKRYSLPDGRADWRCRQRKKTKMSLTKENKADCPCRIVPEREAKRVIMEAFNRLPGCTADLVNKQRQTEMMMRNLDQKIEDNREQYTALAERLDELKLASDQSSDQPYDLLSADCLLEGAAADGNHTVRNGEVETGGSEVELEELHSAIDALEAEYTTLLIERAEAANQEVQIRLLLELVDAMNTTVTPVDDTTPTDAHSVTDTPACYDYEDFFRRTRYILDEGLMENGQLMSFQNDLVVRYLEKVVVEDDGYEVRFKAGISVRVDAVKVPVSTVAKARTA